MANEPSFWQMEDDGELCTPVRNSYVLLSIGEYLRRLEDELAALREEMRAPYYAAK